MTAAPRPPLTRRERRILAVIYPGGTLAAGLSAAEDLYHRGYLQLARSGRLMLTDRGRAAIEQYPEHKWRISDVKPVERVDRFRRF